MINQKKDILLELKKLNYQFFLKKMLVLVFLFFLMILKQKKIIKKTRRLSLVKNKFIRKLKKKRKLARINQEKQQAKNLNCNETLKKQLKEPSLLYPLLLQYNNYLAQELTNQIRPSTLIIDNSSSPSPPFDKPWSKIKI